MIDEAVALYEVDPAGFVAARTQLVRELKAAKRKDDAAIVAKLQRPRMGEYLLNLVARRQVDVVATFAAAVHAATAAQSSAIGSGDGEALRTTSAELRAATSKLIDAAVGDAPARRDEVLTTVRRLTNEGGVAQLVAGIVGSGTQPAELDLFAGAPEPHEVPKREPKPKKAAAPATRATKPKPKPKPKPKQAALEPAQPTKAELAAERRHQAQVERATIALSKAEHEVKVAARAVDAAAARLAHAESTRDLAATELAALSAD